ncbi:MAG: hypothetical protein K0S38_15 [Candidatus Paceibacter sp.]|jgi:hypothetical protein|nr:hypothetical protein [Candidatus Paceibacter sp.]
MNVKTVQEMRIRLTRLSKAVLGTDKKEIIALDAIVTLITASRIEALNLMSKALKDETTFYLEYCSCLNLIATNSLNPDEEHMLDLGFRASREAVRSSSFEEMLASHRPIDTAMRRHISTLAGKMFTSLSA